MYAGLAPIRNSFKTLPSPILLSSPFIRSLCLSLSTLLACVVLVFRCRLIGMSTDQGIDDGTGAGEFMLFGVRVVVDSMRKSVSLNNLSQYEHRLDASSSNNNSDKDVAAGYASADEAVPNSSSVTIAGAGSTGGRERKRGIPWTEEEHKLFLIGLQKVGKGDWRGIARNFVKTRTPTQVASHAQKYFLRRSNLNRRRRRSSLFDITTDSVAAETSSDQQIVKDNNGSTFQSPVPPSPTPIEAKPEMSDYRFSVPETSIYSTTPIYPLPINTPAVGNEMKLAQPAPFLPATFSTGSKSMAEFDLNDNSSDEPSPLSLNLSLSVRSSDLANSPSPSSTRHPELQVMQRLRNGDSMISVA